MVEEGGGVCSGAAGPAGLGGLPVGSQRSMGSEGAGCGGGGDVTRCKGQRVAVGRGEAELVVEVTIWIGL